MGTARDLITLDDVMLYSNITSSTQDDKLELIISSVSKLVKSYCARTFIDNYDIKNSEYTDIIEYFNGTSEFYYTNEFPIVSIESVEYSSDYGSTYEALTEYTDYILDRQGDRIVLFEANNVDLPNAFKITYKGGFAETPQDLKLACFDLVEYYMKKESTVRKSQGTTSVEFITTSDMPSHIKRVLDLYRTIR